ncbi:MAG: Flp family type IVb pilin [Pseudomonadota bacterium]
MDKKLYGISRAFLRDEQGATAIEYALIVGLIFLGIVGAVGAYTDSTSGMYESVGTTLDNATAP